MPSISSSTTSFHLRQLCASLTGDLVGQMTSHDINTLVLPRFLELADDKVWGVRKNITEAMVAVTLKCDKKTRRDILIPLYEKMLDDKSRWVRMAAFSCLSKFILATLNFSEVIDEESEKETLKSKTSSESYDSFTYWREPLPDVSKEVKSVSGPEKLVQHFASMTQDRLKQNVDGDITFRCAAGFASVCATKLGLLFWSSHLRKTFLHLAKDLTWRVRRSIAANLDVIAESLTPEIVSSEITPIFMIYLKDSDEVKFAVLRIFASYFKHLKTEEQTT